jgi:hypothetical protein
MKRSKLKCHLYGCGQPAYKNGSGSLCEKHWTDWKTLREREQYELAQRQSNRIRIKLDFVLVFDEPRSDIGQIDKDFAALAIATIAKLHNEQFPNAPASGVNIGFGYEIGLDKRHLGKAKAKR